MSVVVEERAALSDLATPGLPIADVVQVPCICDHQLEVLVIIDGGADISVVFLELADSDFAVAVLGVLHAVVHLESVQKFS